MTQNSSEDDEMEGRYPCRKWCRTVCAVDWAAAKERAVVLSGVGCLYSAAVLSDR